VIIGGSMETGSYLLAGTESGGKTFFSTRMEVGGP
jgi:tRNA-splicing ligase RtcB